MRVVVAGAGGLGTHVLDMLARLAPLQIEIWDPSILDVPDLNRQMLYTEADLGVFKVEAARRRLKDINPSLTIECRAEAIDSASKLGDLIGGVDVCFDCLDSFAARAALEEAVIHSTQRFNKKAAIPPLFHGGVSGYFGQAAMLLPPDFGYARFFGPNFSEIPDSPKAVMPFSVAMVAATQVSLFIKWLVGTDVSPRNAQLVVINGMDNVTEALEII
jgi:molybdopterin/thiamine biosynthesis adenylyltransferase